MKNASLYSFALTACVLVAAIGVIAAAPSQADSPIPAVNVSLEEDRDAVASDETVLRDWEFTRSREDRCSTGRPG